MRPVWTDAAVPWVAARVEGCERGFEAGRGLAVLNAHGEPVAGVVFHDWNPERGLIEISAAATDRRWITREVVRVVFAYAFDVARLAVTRTAETNQPVRRIWRALGASEFKIPDLWSEGEACVIYTLKPEQLAASRLGGSR